MVFYEKEPAVLEEQVAEEEIEEKVPQFPGNANVIVLFYRNLMLFDRETDFLLSPFTLAIPWRPRV